MADDEFDGGACFLEVDYSIKCNNDTYKLWVGYAMIMIAIYPIGVSDKCANIWNSVCKPDSTPE